MSQKTEQLKKAMQSWWVKAERARFEYGTLGRVNADGTVTVNADRADYYYVTLDTGTLTIAYNGGNGAVDSRAGLPVRVRDDLGKKVIDGVNTAGFSSGDSNRPGNVYTVNSVGPDSHGNVANALDDLSDVNATSPDSGSVFQFNDFMGRWAAVALSALGMVLNDLFGVNVSSETANDLFEYHGGEWVNRQAGTVVGETINNASTDDTIDDTDTFGYTTGSTLKKTAWSNIKAKLKTYFDTLYNLYVHPNHTGDVTSVGDGATTIAANAVITTKINNDAVTFAKMQNIATDSLIGRDTASTGDPENILLNATLEMDGSGNLRRAALTGDVTASAGSNATAIGTNKVLTAMIADAQVTLAKMADLAQSTIIGRAAGAGTGVPTALSVAQVVAIINSTLDHGSLAGLSDDDHAQYLLLAGRSGGQTVSGGTAANDDLTLQGTTNGTRTTSYVLIQPNGGLTAIGNVTPTALLHAMAAAVASTREAVFKGQVSDAGDACVLIYNGTSADTGFLPSFGGLSDGAGRSSFQLVGFVVADTGSVPVIRIDAQTTSNSADPANGTLGAVTTRPVLQVSNNGTVLLLIGPDGQTSITQQALGNPVIQISSIASNDDPTETVYQNKVTTTNATVTTLHTFTIPASTTYGIVGYVTARRTGGTSGTAEDGAFYKIEVAFKNIGGTATILTGTTGVTSLNEDQSAWDCTLSPSGATVRLRVTGAANNNISWVFTGRVYPISS